MYGKYLNSYTNYMAPEDILFDNFDRFVTNIGVIIKMWPVLLKYMSSCGEWR